MYRHNINSTKSSRSSSSLSSPNVTYNFNITLANGTDLGTLLQNLPNTHPNRASSPAWNLEEEVPVQIQSPSNSHNVLEDIDPIEVESILSELGQGGIDWASSFLPREVDVVADVDPDADDMSISLSSEAVEVAANADFEANDDNMSLISEPAENVNEASTQSQTKQSPTPEVLHFISSILVNYTQGGDNTNVMIDPNLSVPPVLKKMTDACKEFITFERTLISARIPKLDGAFDPSDIYTVNAFRRPHFRTRFAYGGNYTGTIHGDILTMLEDLVFTYLKNKAHIATPNCASQDFQLSSVNLISTKDKLGEDFLNSFETRLIHLINGLREKRLLHQDPKRSFCGMASAGMTTSSANQIPQHRRAAIVGGCEPFTNSNSGLLIDGDRLGLTFAELQVMTSIINQVECNDQFFKDAFALPRHKNPRIKRYIQEKRVQHFKALIGEEAWNQTASDFLIEITGILCSLYNHSPPPLTTVASCFIAMRGFLSCAAAVRVADICRFHSDKPGEVDMCKITSTAIFSIPLDAIKDSSYRQELEGITNDPERRHIQFMVALYGRKCVEDYAKTLDLEFHSYESEELDVLVKLIARLLLDGKGTGIDHLARFESKVPWTTQVAIDKSNQESEPKCEKRFTLHSHAPIGSCIFKEPSFDRHGMTSGTCDALLDLFNRNAFKEPIDFLGVLFYASICNSSHVVPTVANYVDAESMFPMSMEEFITYVCKSQLSSGFIKVEDKFRPGSGHYSFCQVDAISRQKYLFFVRPIVEILLWRCHKIQTLYTGTLSDTDKAHIFDLIVQVVDVQMAEIWKCDTLLKIFKNHHPHMKHKVDNPPLLSIFTASILIHYLAIFEFIPRGMISYARIDKDLGSAKAIKNISNILYHQSNNICTSQQRFDWVCNQICLKLKKKFKLKVSIAQIEHILCKIFRMFEAVQEHWAKYDNEDTFVKDGEFVGSWSSFAESICNNDDLLDLVMLIWSEQKRWKEGHVYNKRRQSMNHLFRTNSKGEVQIRDSRNGNEAIMSVSFVFDKDSGLEKMSITMRGLNNSASFEEYYSEVVETE